MHNNSIVSKAVRFALLAGATAAAYTAPVAFAEEGADVERIEVTGSRIKRSDLETASPVTVIDASKIASSGATSIDEVLQELTAAGGAMTNPGINNGSGGNSRINLRGLGAERTLVLVNGRRMIASGTGAASAVDLNTIPLSMIQRVEVLKDGASAIYGTDAVAGVVNIILKRDYEGFEINLQSGRSSKGDAEETSIDFTLGAAFDKGNIVFGAQYTDRGEASQADRGFSDCPIAEASDNSLFCAGSVYSEGGHIWGETADLSGRGGVYDDYVYSGDDNDRFNYAALSFLSTPMQRINLTAAGTYELSDNVLFFTEAMYSKRWSEQQMAPQPIWNSQTWRYNPVSGPGFAMIPDGDGFTGSVVAGFMTDELLGQGVAAGEGLDYGRRMLDTGNREFTQTVDTVRLVVGFEGEFDNGYTWDLSYNKGRNDSVDTLANLHNIGSINAAVQAGDFDPFTQESWQGDSVAPFVYTEVNSGGSELDVFAASLSGELVELPAGYLGFASGYEHRTESAFFTPDSLTAQGLANDPPVESTGGAFTVDEVFVEFAVPLLADLPFAEQVDLSAAARYFDYSTFGDDTTWKLGLTWRVNEDFMLRGVASTAFRAPTVDELFGGASPSFEQIVHPATDQDQAEVTTGGNPLLTPEEADVFTVGVVYEPSFVEGLSFTVDYFDIDIENAINTVDDNYIANQCLGATGELINQGTALCQNAQIAIDGTGRISFNNGLQNLGGAATSGYDLNVAYVFEAANLDWRVSLDTSYLDEYFETDQDGNVQDFKGFITGGRGSYAELKSNLSVSVAADSWDATYEARFIDGMDSLACDSDPAGCNSPSVPSVVYHDIAGSFHVTDSITLSGGINNLFDKQPPYYTGNNDSNTDPFTYDVLGRYIYIKAGIKF